MRKKKASLGRIFDRRKKEPKQLVSGKIKQYQYSFSKETVKTFGQSFFFANFYSQLNFLDELKFFPFLRLKTYRKKDKRKKIWNSVSQFKINYHQYNCFYQRWNSSSVVALARQLFEYILLADQFAGPYYLCVLKQSNNSQVRACLETRSTYLAGKT